MKITRRKALQHMLWLGVMASQTPTLLAQTENIALSIENAKIFMKGQLVNNLWVGISTNGKIILSKRRIKAQKYIDATGLILSNGFVNFLSGNLADDQTTLYAPEKSLQEGVTSVFQLKHQHQNPSIQKHSFTQYNHHLHYGGGICISDFYANSKNRQQTAYFIEQNLDYSSTYAYVHWNPVVLPVEELVHFSKIIRQKDCPLIIRFPLDSKPLENVDNAITLVKNSGVRLHIEHLHLWAKGDALLKVLDKMQQANWIGLPINTSVYPKTYWKNYIKTIQKQAQADSLQASEKSASQDSLSQDSTQNPTKELLAIPFQENLKTALQTEFCFIMPEYTFSAEEEKYFPFLTALQYGLNVGISLEKMLAKMITMPAALIGKPMHQRAEIRNENWADLILFDPRQVQKGQTFQKTETSPIKYVLLGGKIALQNQEVQGNFGSFISRKN